MEVSRERVPLRNAYRHVGQQAVLRVNSGEEYTLQGARCSRAASGAVDAPRSHVLLWTGYPLVPAPLDLQTCASSVRCSVDGAIPTQNAAAAAVPRARRPDGRRDQGRAGADQRDWAPGGEQLAWTVPSADVHFERQVMQLACRCTNCRHNIHLRGLCIVGNQVLVPEGEAKDLLEASAADTVEVGPFQVRLDAAACLLFCTCCL